MLSPGLIIGLAVVALALAFEHFKPQLAAAFAGEADATGGAPPAESDSAPAPSGVAMQYNGMIAAAAAKAGVDPVLMKAIAAQESGFNPNSINPEQDFTLNGVDYVQYSRAGRAALVDWIKNGNDPASIGLDPSVGMMQIRVSEAKQFIRGLTADDLFEPATNFEASSYLAAQMGELFAVPTADVWNVGAGANWRNGVRNAPYQRKVADFYEKFAGDFA